MANPKLEVLTPSNSQLLFIDQQPQMAFGVQSIDRQLLKNNVVALAKAAKVFGIPTTITTVETESFSGHTYPELLEVFPGGGGSPKEGGKTMAKTYRDVAIDQMIATVEEAMSRAIDWWGNLPTPMNEAIDKFRVTPNAT